MNTQTATEAKPAAKLDVPVQRRLVGIVLFEACRFNHSDSVVTKGSGMLLGQETTILPARILASGDWAPLKDGERPDGFGLEQYRGAGKERKLCRGFITMGDVKELVYGE